MNFDVRLIALLYRCYYYYIITKYFGYRRYSRLRRRRSRNSLNSRTFSSLPGAVLHILL